MRAANFRDDVLWAICYLLGLDPQKNLDDDQATALVSFINAWVRRTYDAQDYPEWTRTEKFTVQLARHNVPYNVIPTDDGDDPDKAVQIGRVFKVYLTDPQKTPYRPLDTPHTLRPEGVHVGFEHGDYVWIKFIEQPPQFTAKVWNPNHTYPRGELTYSPVTGQCYMSLGHTNRGQDPSRVGHILMPTELVQEHFPPTMEMASSTKVLELGLTGTQPGPDPPTTPAAGSVWSVTISPTIFSDSALIPVTHTATGTETLSQIAVSLAAALDAAFPTFIITFDTVDPAKPFIRIEDASDFSVSGSWSRPPGSAGPITTTSELPQTVVRSYSVGTPPTPRSRQIMNITLPEDMVMGDAIYSLSFRAPDGKQHYVEYGGLHTDGAAQILTGLAAQITNSADAWFATVQPSVDTLNSVLTLSVEDEFSVDAVLAPTATEVIFWKLIQFPFELIDQVVRGAYANALKEEGQTDKGTGEEKVVPQEMLVSVNSQLKAGQDRMTDQVGGAVGSGTGGGAAQ